MLCEQGEEWLPFTHSGRLSHGVGISKIWGLLLLLGCSFTNSPSWALFIVPRFNFSPRPLQSPAFLQLLLRVHLLHWPLLASSSHALQLTPSGIQNQYLRDLHMTKFSCQHGYNVGCLWNPASLCSQKTLPRRFHLSVAGLLLITANT